MSILTMDSLVSAINSAVRTPFQKASATGKAAGSFQDLFYNVAGLPAAGVIPGSANGVNPTNATAGSLALTNPSGSNTLYLSRIMASSSTIGTLILYDRLWHNSGLDGTVTSAQSYTQPALTRYTTGVGVEPWLEVYTATGATPQTATLSYTNQNGTAAQSATCTLIATPVAGQLIPFNLASGDTGAQLSASVTLAGSTGTAGNFGIVFLRRIAEIPLSVANVATVLGWQSIGMPTIQNSACLSFMVMLSTTNTGTLFGSADIIQG